MLAGPCESRHGFGKALAVPSVAEGVLCITWNKDQCEVIARTEPPAASAAEGRGTQRLSSGS